MEQSWHIYALNPTPKPVQLHPYMHGHITTTLADYILRSWGLCRKPTVPYRDIVVAHQHHHHMQSYKCLLK